MTGEFEVYGPHRRRLRLPAATRGHADRWKSANQQHRHLRTGPSTLVATEPNQPEKGLRTSARVEQTNDHEAEQVIGLAIAQADGIVQLREGPVVESKEGGRRASSAQRRREPWSRDSRTLREPQLTWLQSTSGPS